MSARADVGAGGWALLAILAVLWTVHVVASAANGFALPETTRDRFGASAETVWSRFHAHFLAPFFHDGLFHLAYNSAILALVVPLAFRRFGGKAIALGYLAGPAAAVLVELLVLLPLARAGVAPAIETAHARLVGASVVAFALAGMVLVGLAPRLAAWTFAIAGVVGAYEAILALAGVTRPFIWAYHLGGFAVGAGLGVAMARNEP